MPSLRALVASLAIFTLACAAAMAVQADQAPSMALQIQHSAPTIGLAVSPDGHTIATSGQIVALWDARTGRLRRTLADRAHFAALAAFSPDGAMLASVGFNGSTDIWNTHTGALIRRLVGSDKPMSAVAFSPDGATLATAGWNGVDLWNPRTGALGRRLAVTPTKTGWHNFVVTLKFLGDGRAIAGATYDGPVDFWNARSNRPMAPGSPQTDVTGAAFDRNGSEYAIVNQGIATLWSTTPNRRIRRIGDESDILAVAFSPDGSYLAETRSSEPEVLLMDKHMWKVVRTLTGDSGSFFSAVVVSPDSRSVIASAAYGRPQVWDATTGKELSPSGPGKPWMPQTIAYSPDGTELAGVCHRRVFFWDTATGIPTAAPISGSARAGGLTYSPDGRSLALGCADGTVALCDVATGNVYRTLVSRSKYVIRVAYSPDGALVAGGGSDGIVWVWRGADGDLLWSGQVDSELPESIWRVGFSPDGSEVAAASAGDFRVWKAGTGEEVKAARVVAATDFAFSPDGSTLAAVDSMWRVVLVNTHTWVVIPTSKAFPTDAWRLAYSPDGTKLAVNLHDDTVEVIDAHDGHVIRVLDSGLDPADFIAFSPDGSRVTVSSEDGALRTWNASTGAILETGYVVSDPAALPPAAPSPTGPSRPPAAMYGWLTVTPAGYFDCSSRTVADAYISWTVGDTIYPADKFYDRFYRPDLVRAALATGLTH